MQKYTCLSMILKKQKNTIKRKIKFKSLSD